MQFYPTMYHLLVSAVWYLLLWKEVNGSPIFENNPFLLHKVISPQINNGVSINTSPPGTFGQIHHGQQPENNVVNIQAILPPAANNGFNSQVSPQNNFNFVNPQSLPVLPSPSHNQNVQILDPNNLQTVKPFSPPSSSVLPPFLPQTQSTLQLSPPIFPLIIDQNTVKPASPVFTYVTKPPQSPKLPEPSTPIEYPQIPDLPRTPQLPSFPENDYSLRQLCLQPRGQFPTRNCNSYVNCWDEVVIEESCPEGLVFNTAGFCDFPANVSCQGRTVDISLISSSGRTETPQFQVNPQLKKRCAQSRGLFLSDHCFTFINCWDDNVVEEYCPTNLYFSEKGYCDYPSNVNCNGRLTYENYFQRQPESQHNGFVPPPLTVNQEGNKVTQGPIDSSTQPEIGSDPELNKKCLKSNGLFPSHSCDKYVNCWNGLAVEQECAPDLFFSENGYCDFAQNVDCQGRKVPYQVQSTGTPVLGNLGNKNLFERCKGQKGQFLTERCNTYLECWEDAAVERECPPGLFFSQIQGYCEFSHKVDCQNRVVPEKKIEPQCIDGTYRNAFNCSQYYVCSGGLVTSRHECPSGLRYNEVLGVCDFANRVECSAPVNNVNSFQGVPAELADQNLNCIPGRIFRLNLNCTSVAICREDGTEVATCPEGSAYDTPTDRCVYPQYARCYDRKA